MRDSRFRHCTTRGLLPSAPALPLNPPLSQGVAELASRANVPLTVPLTKKAKARGGCVQESDVDLLVLGDLVQRICLTLARDRRPPPRGAQGHAQGHAQGAQGQSRGRGRLQEFGETAPTVPTQPALTDVQDRRAIGVALMQLLRDHRAQHASSPTAARLVRIAEESGCIAESALQIFGRVSLLRRASGR